MTARNARTTTALLGAACLGLALTACGSQSASSASSPAASASPRQVVLDAVALTPKARTAHMTISSKVSVSGTQITTMDGSGDMAFDASAGTLRMSMTTMGKSVAVDEVVVDRSAYLKSAAFGPKWLKVDISKAATGSNPSDSLALLKKIADVKQVGTEQVGGATTTHYAGTVDIMAALGRSGMSGAFMNIVKSTLAQGGATTAHIDVWIDGQGRAVRTQDSFSLTIQGQKLDSTSEVDLSDFGVQVHVVAPPADQVRAAPSGLFGRS